MGTYFIHESLLQEFERRTKAIRNKCNKQNVEFNFEVIGEEFKTIINDGEAYEARFFEIEVSGRAHYNGWRFIATLNHTADGNIIRSAAEDVEVPKSYQAAKCTCDHCNTNRARKETYVILNEETGEFKQVGKQCLKEYTNGLDAEDVARYLSYFACAKEMSEKPVGGHGYAMINKWYNLNTFLLYVAECMHHWGYQTTKMDLPTSRAAKVLMQYFEFHVPFPHETRDMWMDLLRPITFDAHRVENQARVDAALEFLKSSEDDSNFMNNLRVICKSPYIGSKDLGIAGSLLQTHHRNTLREEEKCEARKRLDAAQKTSNHVGSVGSHVEVEVAEMRCMSSYYSQFGPAYFYRITDTAGNVFTWSTGNYIDLDNATVKMIRGKVRNHSEYRGVKQTELTRCKVEYNNPAKEA